MFKWIGAMLIVAGMGLSGVDLYKKQKKELELTEAFLKVLTFMKDEMQYSKAYLDAVLEKCVHVTTESADFFQKIATGLQQEGAFKNLWDESVNDLENLNSAVKGELLEMGNILGNTDLDSQKNLICHTVEQIQSIKEDQEKALKTRGTFYPKIGFSIGILVAILLF